MAQTPKLKANNSGKKVAMEHNKTASQAMAQTPKLKANNSGKKVTLESINEGESLDLKEEMQCKIREQEDQIARMEVERDGTVHLLQVQIEQMARDADNAKKAHQKTVDALKKKNKESNKRVNTLQKDIKNLKHKIKKCEKENKKLAAVQQVEVTKKNIQKDLLAELYLNSSRIRDFMNAVKKYGEQFKELRRTQTELTTRIGVEDVDTLKLRMSDLTRDIKAAERSYNDVYESLDMMKTESQGKELEVLTKDREYIDLLEKEKFTQSSHLEEYVKKNQTLQLDLTDREMKLRQAQNELNHLKQRITKLEQQSMMQQQQQQHQQVQQQHPQQRMQPRFAPQMNVYGQPFGGQNVNVFNGGYNVYNQY